MRKHVVGTNNAVRIKGRWPWAPWLWAIRIPKKVRITKESAVNGKTTEKEISALDLKSGGGLNFFEIGR
jgi:hypothetical protein